MNGDFARPDSALPCDRQAEERVLAAVLARPEEALPLVRQLGLRHGEFTSPAFGAGFRAAMDFDRAGRTPDLPAVMDIVEQHLSGRGSRDVILAELADFARQPGTVADLAFYVKTIRDLARRREGIILAESRAQAWRSPNGAPFAEELATFEADLREIRDSTPDAENPSRLPAPLGVRELLEVEEPEVDWLAEGLISAGGNVLCAAYPKSFKTLLVLEVAVALATGTPLLGLFPVPARRRSGLILMEDQAHRIRYRLARLCQGRGIALRDLDGWLHLWFRPKIRLLDERLMMELGAYARDLELDLLAIDSWSYVASGDSNSSDEVTPQLQAFGDLRDHRPGLTTWLTHHAAKSAGRDTSELRITDIIRNSTQFGAWYETGLLLERKAEESNLITIRTELRDGEPQRKVAVEVLDEFPADPPDQPRSSGWLRISAVAGDAMTALRNDAGKRLAPAVLDFITDNRGCSKRAIRDGVKGGSSDIDAAINYLESANQISVYKPIQNGKGMQFYPAGEGKEADRD